jgi:HNH endonuclease
MPLPTKADVVAYWMRDDRLFREHELLLDWGEPSCWACSYGWDGKYDLNDAHVSYDELPRLWLPVPLQRCHITPRSLGGSDDPANLVLMCAECHDLAPDLACPELLFRWMRAQCWLTRRMRRMEQAMKDLGVDTEDEAVMQRFTDTIRSGEFKAWQSGRAGLHRRQLPPYGSGVSESTLVAVVLQFMDERGTPLIPLHPWKLRHA